MSINQELKKQLVDMLKVDQEVRVSQSEKLKELERSGIDKSSFEYKHEIRKLVNELAKLDKKNTLEVKKIIEEFGWPGISLVGKKGAYAAWLLVQHATHDLNFQKECLEILREAVKNKEAEEKHLAYLTDRVLVQEGKKQIYGTQFKGKDDGTSEPFPINNPEALSDLREAAGLEPFAKYKKKMEALNLR